MWIQLVSYQLSFVLTRAQRVRYPRALHKKILGESNEMCKVNDRANDCFQL
jgi:hypothetical protein